MFGKCLSLALASVLLLTASSVPARAGQQASAEALKLEKLRKKAGKFAGKRGCKARVKLDDGRELKGRITEATDEYFVIVSSETHTATTVRYPQVLELKESRPSRIPMVVGMVGVLCLITIPFMVSGPN